jgi:hypothetical protein
MGYDRPSVRLRGRFCRAAAGSRGSRPSPFTRHGAPRSHPFFPPHPDSAAAKAGVSS